MNILGKAFSTLLVPILLFDVFSGIIGFMWLATYGEWGTLLGGILWLAISTFVISIVLLPSVLLSMPAMFCAKRNNVAGLLFFGLLSAVYVSAVIYFSCTWLFVTYTARIPASDSIIPYLLWTYAIALAPWAYMASKEGEEATGTFTALFFAKFGLLGVVISTGFLGSKLQDSLMIFFIALVLNVLVTVVLAVFHTKRVSQPATEDLVDTEALHTSADTYYVNRDNVSLGDYNSILLVGETGTGKSELVHSIIKDLKSDYTPDEIAFVLFDLKQVEFVHEDVTYLYKDVITKPSTGVRAIKDLIEYADLRIKKRQKFPALLVYIEECDMAVQHAEMFEQLMIRLINTAKAANFCVIYATSRVGPETVGPKLLGHFDTIWASRLPRGSTRYLGVGDTSSIQGYNFRDFGKSKRTAPGIVSRDHHKM